MSLIHSRKLAAFVLALSAASTIAYAAEGSALYQLQSVLNLGGTGASWDHIDYDQVKHVAYLSRGADGLTVVDVAVGKVVARVANAKGSVATALAPKLDRGYTANADGSTSVFKLSDFSAVQRVSFGDNFDGVVYDEATNILAYQQADDSKELLVDAKTMELIGTIEVEGEELERPVVDGNSNLYLPIRDKNLVYKIDLKAKKIVARWDISAKCTEPSGSAFDVANNRLLLPCRGMMVDPVVAVIDAMSGDVTATYPTGRGADDVIFDPASKQLFVANGVDANINVFKQESADKYVLTEAFQTRPGLRVMRYDSATQKIYGMTAEGTFDARKKTNTAVSPFYPNKFFDGTFVMLTYGRGPAAK